MYVCLASYFPCSLSHQLYACLLPVSLFCLPARLLPVCSSIGLIAIFSLLLNKERKTCHLSVSHCGRLTKYSHTTDLQVACSVCDCLCWKPSHSTPNGNLDTSLVRPAQLYLIETHTHEHTYFHATEELIKHHVPGWEQDCGKDVCLCVWLNHAECSVGERQAGQLWQL